MQIAIFLSTVLVSLIGLACAFVAYRESRAAEAAESRIEKRLAALAGITARVSAVEASFESLRLQHQKLHGKFHATLRELEDEREAAFNRVAEPQREDWEQPQPPLPFEAVCENYAAAQREGPGSPAAECQCAYCLRRRAERDALRKKLPQGTHADRVRAIEAAS